METKTDIYNVSIEKVRTKEYKYTLLGSGKSLIYECNNGVRKDFFINAFDVESEYYKLNEKVTTHKPYFTFKYLIELNNLTFEQIKKEVDTYLNKFDKDKTPADYNLLSSKQKIQNFFYGLISFDIEAETRKVLNVQSHIENSEKVEMLKLEIDNAIREKKKQNVANHEIRHDIATQLLSFKDSDKITFQEYNNLMDYLTDKLTTKEELKITF